MNDTRSGAWPELPYAAWKETCETLQLWAQVVGKIRLAGTPWVNHSWHVPLYVTCRGLTTTPIPHGSRFFEIAFDFIDSALDVTTSDGERARLALEPMTVAEFYGLTLSSLHKLGLAVQIDELPCEIPGAVRFSEDRVHGSYDRESVLRFWRALLQADRLLKQFRTRFLGKCSPVHFFWGSFDLAVTRFSGRPAPLHPGKAPGVAPEVMREAYSHEVSSAGFWPGGSGFDDAAFYSYAYPEPPGFKTLAVKPRETFYSEDLGQFLLPYEAVRQSSDPDVAVLDFLQCTYAAAASAAKWDRAALEGPPGLVGVPRPVT